MHYQHFYHDKIYPESEKKVKRKERSYSGEGEAERKRERERKKNVHYVKLWNFLALMLTQCELVLAKILVNMILSRIIKCTGLQVTAGP